MLLINPWIVDFAAYDFWIKPLGLLTIGAVLHHHGYHVELLDCMDRMQSGLEGKQSSSKHFDGTGHFYKEKIPKPEILSHIPRQYSRYGLSYSNTKKVLSRCAHPDVICITSGMTYWYPGVVDMIKLLRQIFHGVPVILGGIYASLCPEHARSVSGADVIVVGEGEDQILDVFSDILSDTGLMKHDISCDDMISPLYDLYPSLESAAVLTSRGCPFDCPFCASKQLVKSYRRRNPLQIIEEIQTIHEKKHVKHFAFFDDALLLNRQACLIPVLQELIYRKIDIRLHTPNGIRPKEIDHHTASLMNKAGFQTIRLSYETRNQERQRQMDFKVTDTDLAEAVRLLFDAGFKQSQIGAYVLMGLPEQGIAEIVDSMMFVLGLGIKVSLASYSPIPGTRSWEEAVKLGYLTEDTDPLLTNNSIFPLKSDYIPYNAFTDLGTLSSVANRVLSVHGNPLTNGLFKDKMKVFKKAWMN